MFASVASPLPLVHNEAIRATGLLVDGWLAMMTQIIHQMLGRQLRLTPRVSFGDLQDAGIIGGTDKTLEVITSSAQHLMASHMAWQA